MAVRIAPPTTVQQKGVEEQLSQTGLQTSVAQLAKLPIVNGRKLAAVKFSVGTSKRVDHGMRRVPQGVIPMLTPNSTNAPVLNVTAWDDRSVTFMPLGDCTVDLWVF